MSEYSDYKALVEVVLQDVTDETAAEFWRRLDGHEIELRLHDGLEYICDVRRVMTQPRAKQA